MSAAADQSPRKRSVWIKLGVVASVFFAMFLAWRYSPLAELVTAERAMGWARAFGSTPWAPVAAVLIYTPAAFVMFPRPLLTLFTVLAFGPWYGFAISLIGIIVSAMATYALGRTLPERTVHRLAGRRLERISHAVRRRGIMSSFAVSVAPVAPFPVVGMVAGAVRIKLRDYLLGMTLGMLPGTLATTVFAHQIAAVLEDPERINYWVVAAVILVLVLLLWGARRWVAKVQEEV